MAKHSHSFTEPLPNERLSGKFTEAEAKQARRLFVVLCIIASFFGVELTGALMAKSNVLKADALHLLMDVFAIAMSLLAMRLAVRKPTARFTFGLRRAEPVAAIFNAILVLGATVEIVREGIEELHGGEPPIAGIMMVVSIGALMVNGLSAWLLHDVIGHHGHAHGPATHDHAHEKKKAGGHALNLRGARLHLLGDTLGSLAALLAALAIHFGGPPAIDAIASFAVALILVLGAIGLLKDATLVLLEAAPVHLPIDAIREVVANFPGVSDVHDMHVWTLGAGHDALTVHVVRSENGDSDLGPLLSKKLRESFTIEYVTVQVEATKEPCGAPPSRFVSED